MKIKGDDFYKVCRDGSPSSKTLHRPGMSHAQLLAAAAKQVVQSHRDGIDPGWHWTLPEKYQESNRG